MVKRGRKPLSFDDRLQNVLTGFWQRVERGDPDECWAWTGHTVRSARKQFRYGNYVVWNGSSSKSYRAHRFSWMLANGPIPEGMNVLHRCDNSNCVNPAHLFLGTQRDNVYDQIAKGRWLTGEQAGRAKLTEKDVLEILASDEPITVLARRYGVTDCPIRKIREGRSWKHLTANNHE